MSPPVTHPDVDYIVAEMHRMHAELRGDIKVIRFEQLAQAKDIAGLKVKAGLWGAVAGLIPMGLLACGVFIKGHLSGDTP